MVSISNCDSALVQLCAVDYLTGATLIDMLVQPSERVRDWRSKYSGITPQMLYEATSQGKVLFGWQAAREALLNYVDADTVLVGHSLQHDLDALRLLHSRVVDSVILAGLAAGGGVFRQWALKTLCQELLLTAVQDRRKKGHDCMEDTLAAREVVIWATREEEQLKEWAVARRKENEKRLEEEKKKREKEKKKKEQDAAKETAEKKKVEWGENAAESSKPKDAKAPKKQMAKLRSMSDKQAARNEVKAGHGHVQVYAGPVQEMGRLNLDGPRSQPAAFPRLGNEVKADRKRA